MEEQIERLENMVDECREIIRTKDGELFEMRQNIQKMDPQLKVEPSRAANDLFSPRGESFSPNKLDLSNLDGIGSRKSLGMT